MAFRIYKRRLSHARRDGATYFVTWCLCPRSADLQGHEREMVVEALRHFANHRYQLHAFVIMNDHVHVVVTPYPGRKLEKLIQSWKSHSAKCINRARGASGRLWQVEYIDRILTVRWGLENAIHYVISNPLRRWPNVVVYPWVWQQGMR